jgi:hypothetical protein
LRPTVFPATLMHSAKTAPETCGSAMRRANYGGSGMVGPQGWPLSALLGFEVSCWTTPDASGWPHPLGGYSVSISQGRLSPDSANTATPTAFPASCCGASPRTGMAPFISQAWTG